MSIGGSDANPLLANDTNDSVYGDNRVAMQGTIDDEIKLMHSNQYNLEVIA